MLLTPPPPAGLRQRITYAIVEHGRAAEWLTSSVLLVMALILAVPGETMAAPTFRVLLDLGLDDAALSAPIALLGTARLAALYINGAWRRSPMLRMIGAILGSMIFGVLAVAFALPSLIHGAALSIISGVFFVMALFDALAAHRSGADVRLAAVPRL